MIEFTCEVQANEDPLVNRGRGVYKIVKKWVDEQLIGERAVLYDLGRVVKGEGWNLGAEITDQQMKETP